jgi:hypothetical protein
VRLSVSWAAWSALIGPERRSGGFQTLSRRMLELSGLRGVIEFCLLASLSLVRRNFRAIRWPLVFSSKPS